MARPDSSHRTRLQTFATQSVGLFLGFLVYRIVSRFLADEPLDLGPIVVESLIVAVITAALLALFERFKARRNA